MEKSVSVPERFGAVDFKDLFTRVYMEVDQCLMHRGLWDYHDCVCGTWLTNKIYTATLSLDPDFLSEEDLMWQRELLWFWNHHAISCAIWRHRDFAAARQYAATALCYQDQGHSNKITRLFALLLDDRLEEATQWVKTVSEAEQDAACFVMQSYLADWSQNPAT